MKKIKIAVVIMVMALCAGAFAACFNGDAAGPKAAFKSFVSAFNACYADGFKEEDCKKVAAAFGPSGNKEYNDALTKINAKKEKSGKDKYTVKLTVVKYAEWDVKGNEATATITVKVVEKEEGSKDKTNNEDKSIKFKKSGSEWYIDGITFTFFK